MDKTVDPQHVEQNPDCLSHSKTYLMTIGKAKNALLDVWHLPNEAPHKYKSIHKALNTFHERKMTFMQKSSDYLALLSEKEEINKFTTWYDTQLLSLADFEDPIRRWLQSMDTKRRAEKLSNPSIDEASSISSRRSATSKTSSKARYKIAKAKAKLLAEEEAREALTRLEEREKKLREDERRRIDEQEEKEFQIRAEERKKKADQEENERVLKKERDRIATTRRRRQIELLEESLDRYDFDIRSVSMASFREENYDHAFSALGNAPSVHLQSSEPKTNLEDCNTLPPKKSLDLHERPTCVSDVCHSSKIGNDKIIQELQIQNKLSMELLKGKRTIHLPKQVPTVFNGDDVTKYRLFIEQFKVMIESKCPSNAERYYYLLEFTAGRARSLVESSNSGDPDSAYQIARALLLEQFGNGSVVVQTMLKKLESWNAVKSEDGLAIQDFYLFLVSCETTLRQFDEKIQLDSPTIIEKLTSKLPVDLRRRFRTLCIQILDSGSKITFDHFLAFIKAQSREWNLPIFGAVGDSTQRDANPTISSKKTVFAMKTFAEDSRVSPGTYPRLDCKYCKRNNHCLQNCFDFAKRNVDEQHRFIRENDLCFSCLKVGHISNACQKRLSCSKCSRKHPTCMHRDVDLSASNSQVPSSAHGGVNDSSLVMAVKSDRNAVNHSVAGRRSLFAAIPVVLRHKNDFAGENAIETYMGLDGFSSDSFLDLKLTEQLGLTGLTTELRVTTMNSSGKRMPCCLFSDLVVTSLDGSVEVCLPAVYGQGNWPFALQDSPKSDDIKNFEHLSNLPFNFIKSKIGILIGTNVPQLLRPMEVVSGGADDPFATRHLLGWAITGSLLGDKNTKCFKTSVCSIGEQREDLEYILNGRPLTVLSNDVTDARPLNLNHLLLIQDDPSPPMGTFIDENIYSRHRWKVIQHLADVFWRRWRKEYLVLLQERQKWRKPRSSISGGDIVLVSDIQMPRNRWPLGRVIQVKKGTNELVRSAYIRLSRDGTGRDLNVSTTIIERPISKLILLSTEQELSRN